MCLELGANLLGQERVQPGGQGPEEGSTSGVSTVNSVKSQKTADSIDNKYWKEYRDQMGALKIENMKLLQELIESQKTYQTLLQQALEEQRAQINTLTHLCENINRRTRQESGYETNYYFIYYRNIHKIYINIICNFCCKSIKVYIFYIYMYDLQL